MTNKRKRERVRNAQKRDTKNNAKHKTMKHAALKVAKAYAPLRSIEASILAASTLLPCVKQYQTMILEKILLGRRLAPYVNHNRNHINV